MLRYVVAGLLLISLFFLPASAQNPEDSTLSKLLFTEVLTNGSSGEKFIEVFNPNNSAVSLEGWKIHRTNVSGEKDWSANSLVALSGEIQARGFYLVATPTLSTEKDITHNLSNLKAEEGNIRLVDNLGQYHDLVGWGANSTKADTTPIVKVDELGEVTSFTAGESFKRRVDEDGRFIDTDDNSQDWIISMLPTPQSTPVWNPPETEEIENSSTGAVAAASTSNTNVLSSANKPAAKLVITELLIDPGTPLKDAEDEFVEIYNPTTEAVDLEGYSIQTGIKYNYKFTLPNISIKSGEYLALFSLDTNLTLSNSEGQARLLGPSGEPVYEVPAYSDAKTDTAWADINGEWQWTNLPTPGAPNQAGSNETDSSSGSGASLSRGRVASENSQRTEYEDPPASEEQIDTAVLAGVGALAVLYAGNEYRHDVANYYTKLKRYLQSRRSRR